MRSFTRKGYGRIYVEKEEDIPKVKEIIEQMDEYEYSYMPKDYITTFDDYPSVAYTHKFDSLNIDALTAICWDKGIKIFCLDNGHNEWANNEIKEFNRKEKE
jgi:hypothetical protein